MNKKLIGLFFCAAAFFLFIPGLTAKADTNGDFIVQYGVLTEYKGSSANVVIPGDLGIKKIGVSAFRDKDFIVSVSIPDSVIDIGDYVFNNCTSLTSVTMGKGVASIGKEVFSSSTKLKTINVDSENRSYYSKDGVLYSKVRVGMLYDKNQELLICYPAGKEDTVFNVPKGVVGIESYAFSHSSLRSIIIPNSVIIIYEGAFSKCKNLQSITIPRSVTWIEDKAFEYCTNLTSVTIPTSVIHLGKRVFYYCESLKSVVIPSSVTSLGQGAFDGCKGLTSVIINKGITQIANETFYNCTSLTNVSLPDSVTTIWDNAFENCTSLANLTIPNSVTEIKGYAFKSCTSLLSITFPRNVMSIGDYAFTKCTSLKNVTMPEYLGSINEGVFNECTSLTRVTIPKSVASIGKQAFYSCSSLTEAKFLGNAPVMGDSVFGSSSARFKVLYPDNKTGYSNPWNGYNAESFKLGSYKIVYDGNGNTGGSVPEDYSAYFEGDEVLIRANTGSLTKTGYTFSGWNTQADGNGISYGAAGFDSGFAMGPGNVTLYAKWADNSYNKYQYTLADNNATIIGYTGIGGDLVIPSVVDGHAVASIGEYAFYSYTNLTSVTIPDGIKSIGEGAFDSCINLTSVTIPYSVNSIGEAAFFNCRSLTSINIPPSIRSIGDFAFSNCTSLTNAAISYNVTSISDYMFSGSSNLKSVNIPNGATKIGDYAFNMCGSLSSISIPSTVTKIGNGAFAGCAGLKSISIPDSVTSIGDGAFHSCRGLTSVTIPNSVTRIGYYTFEDCANLLSVRLSNRLTSIGSFAFEKCINLRSVTIPDSVTVIEDAAFEYCSSLTSVIIPNSVTSIGEKAFGNCSSLRDITIPDSVKYIGDSAFNHNSSLISVTIPGKVNRIGAYMFEYSQNLVRVIIPDSVTDIGEYSFTDCSSLTNITIPESVKSIGNGAFSYCDSLSEAKFQGNAPEMGDTVFDDTAYNFKVYYLNGKSGFTNPWHGYSTATYSTQAYTVTYSGNGNTGGSVPKDSNTYLQGDVVTAMGNTGSLTKIGYIFDGWNTRPDNSGITYSINPPGNTFVMEQANVFLYVKWAASSNADYLYTLNGSEATITGYTGKGGNITIPAQIDGYRVTGIGDKAFYSLTNITSVVIPRGVKSVGSFAFAGCSNLTDVIFPDSVTSIGNNAFNSCSRLTGVNLPEGITNISDGLFYYCFSLASINIPKSVTSIGMYGFVNCISLRSVTVPENVNNISSNAFRNCSSLSEAKFLGNAPEMGSFVFDGSAESFMIYYLEGKTGFTNPWYGYPTQVLGTNTFTVSFESNGGSEVPDQTVAANAYAIRPSDPVREGYTFGGWYLDNNTFANLFDFANTAVTADITLYAKWIPIKVLSNIVVTTPPKKTDYLVGESLDLTGIVVTGYYSDGTTTPVNVAMDNISGFDSSKPVKDQVVTVTFEGKTAGFTVNIIDKSELIVNANIKGGTYNKAQNVILTASEPSTIYYTTDSKDPTEKSKKYTAPIKISSDTTLKFIAIDKEGNKSDIYIEKYVIDTAAPKVKAITPAKNLKNISLDTSITLELTEEIQQGAGRVSLMDSKKTSVPLDIAVSQENKKLLVITPKTNLRPSEKYTLTIGKDSVRDMVGNSISSTYSSIFYTIIMPVVNSASPANNASRVKMNSSIAVRFNVKVYAGDGFKGIKLEYIQGNERRQVNINVALSGTTLTVKPVIELRGDTIYYITIPKNAVKDTSTGTGKTMIEDYFSQFTTEPETVIKAISSALLKLPADDTVANKIKTRTTLQKYLDAVNKAIVLAKAKEIPDSQLLELTNYGRIAVAQKRIDALKAAEDEAAKLKAISAVSTALKKLPADDIAAAKLKSRTTLQKYVDAVYKAIAAAKEKGAADPEIQALPDYGRIAVALRRLEELK